MDARTPLVRNSSDLLRAVIDHLAEGVLILDASGKVITANPAAEEILGVPAPQIACSGPADERWRPVQEDGSDWPSNAHPSLDTLATGRPHRDVKGRQSARRLARVDFDQHHAGRPA